VGALSLVFGRTLFAAVSLAPLVNWHNLKATKNRANAVGNGGLLAVHWLSFLPRYNVRRLPLV